MTEKRGRRRRLPAPLSDDPLYDDRGLSKRKLRQLCRQVERALSTALADNPRLLDLSIDSVLPWPNASRLLVAVRLSDPTGPVDRAEVLGRLEQAKASLRMVVAHSVHRKRVPDLCFEVFTTLVDL